MKTSSTGNWNENGNYCTGMERNENQKPKLQCQLVPIQGLQKCTSAYQLRARSQMETDLQCTSVR